MISNPSLSKVSVPFLRSSILCDVSSGSPQSLVPTALRHQLFLALHGLSHLGAGASWRLLSSRFVWPRLAKDACLWTRSCLWCQLLDLMGPLPSCQGFNYLLTVVDRTSQLSWPLIEVPSSHPPFGWGFVPSSGFWGSWLPVSTHRVMGWLSISITLWNPLSERGWQFPTGFLTSLWWCSASNPLPRMILVSLLHRQCLVLPFLSQASSSNTQSYLRTFFSNMTSKQLLVSPALLDIT